LGGRLFQHLGRNPRRENAKSYLAVIARSGSDEAIQLSCLPHYGLLRFARNDGGGLALWLFEM
jgi:hypothetical protein